MRPLAFLASIGASLLLGAGGGWYARALRAPSIVRSNELAELRRTAVLEDVGPLEQTTATVAAARGRAEERAERAIAGAASAHRRGQEAASSARHPPTPARAAELAPGAVAEARDGREGFWVPGTVLADLETSKSAAAAWSEERAALLEALEERGKALDLASAERAALEAQVARWRLAYTDEASARADLAASASVGGGAWYESSPFWIAAGVAGAALAVTAVALAR